MIIQCNLIGLLVASIHSSLFYSTFSYLGNKKLLIFWIFGEMGLHTIIINVTCLPVISAFCTAIFIVRMTVRKTVLRKHLKVSRATHNVIYE
jgi:hypothetical protein